MPPSVHPAIAPPAQNSASSGCAASTSTRSTASSGRPVILTSPARHIGRCSDATGRCWSSSGQASSLQASHTQPTIRSTAPGISLAIMASRSDLLRGAQASNAGLTCGSMGGTVVAAWSRVGPVQGLLPGLGTAWVLAPDLQMPASRRCGRRAVTGFPGDPDGIGPPRMMQPAFGRPVRKRRRHQTSRTYARYILMASCSASGEDVPAFFTSDQIRPPHPACQATNAGTTGSSVKTHADGKRFGLTAAALRHERAASAARARLIRLWWLPRCAGASCGRPESPAVSPVRAYRLGWLARMRSTEGS